jgi:carboxypeptidase Taq
MALYTASAARFNSHMAKEAYAELVEKLKEVQTLESVGGLLGWDQETYMPQRGSDLRARQMSMLARMNHEAFISPRIGELLAEVGTSALATDHDGDVAVVVRETKRLYDRATKLPPSLIEEMTRTAVLAQHAWIDARKNSDYALFAPWLDKTLDLKRTEAKCVGYKGHIYNALLDPFEPDETAENLTVVFADLRRALVDLVGKIVGSGRKAPVELLHRHYPKAAQEALAREAAERVGFDFTSGRLDVSVHPFNSGMGPGDCRMTTRYDENFFGDAARALRAGVAGRPVGHAAGAGRVAGDSRVAVADVGKSRGALAAVLEVLLPPTAAAVPRVDAGHDRRAVAVGGECGAAVADPHGVG